MYRFSLRPGEGYDFKDQLEICKNIGIYNLELDESMAGKLFIDMDENIFRKSVITEKIYVPMLNMKQNTGSIDRNYLKEHVRKCGLLGIEYLNVGDVECNACVRGCTEDAKDCSNDAKDCYDDVKDHIAQMEDYIADVMEYCCLYNVSLCIENRYGHYFNNSKNLDAFFKSRADREDLFLAFNPLEFVRSKRHPFLNVFYNGKFKSSIAFLRITDGLYFDGSPELPGKGSGEIKELVSALTARSYKGYLSFVPYFEKQSVEDYKRIFRSLAALAVSL